MQHSSGRVTLQAPSSPGAAAWQLIRSYRPLKQPLLTTTLLLWLLGLFLVFLSPAPVAITPEKMERFESLLKQAEGDAGVRRMAEDRLQEAYWAAEERKVWFWRFRPAHRPAVRALLADVRDARAGVDRLNAQRDRLLSEAKAQLGLWSDAGLQDSRRMFWKSFESGKLFARRQTFWDGIMIALGSRERNALGMLLQLLLTALVNTTIGVCTSVFVFAARLPGLVMEYQASLLSATTFFMLALLGAVSVVAGFLGALYASSAAGVYAVAALINSSRQLEGRQQARPRPIPYGNARWHAD